MTVNPIPEQMSVVFAAGVAVLAFLSTLALHRMHRGQAALLAALLVGTFLGPSVLGRVAPDLHDRLRLGGATELREMRLDRSEDEARQWLERQRSANMRSIDRTVAGEEGIPTPSLVNWFLAGGCLLLLGITCVRDGRTVLADLPLGASLAIGCGGVGLLIARGTIEDGNLITSIVLAGACAAAVGTRWGFFDARRVRMNGAARVSTMTVITVMVVVLADRLETTDPVVYLLAVPLLASLLSTRGRRWITVTRAMLARYLPSMIVAVSMLTIDLIENIQCLWIAVLAWLTMSDLRSVLCALMLRSTGLGGLRSLMNSLQLMGTGLMPVALAGYMVWVVGLPAEVACGLFLAGAVAEIEGITRASAGRALCSIRRMNRE